MMDETNRFAFASAADGTPDVAEPTTGKPDETTQPQPSAPEGADTEVNEAVMKFRSCRWRSDPADGEYCTHRDVLPFAGKEGFVPESWCPDCTFFKLRRTPKKRSYSGY
ncbi:MAG TPA: hypothetical protein VGD94_01475 [Vicinamibacterales bacterium]